jgi:hypothetical protein
MDAQLSDDVDQPQKDYFDLIAREMPENSRIILCGPEPGWLYTETPGSNSLSVLDNIAQSAINAERGLEIALVLSGDTHHYSRYTGNDGVTQFITAGGGGAFLHPTHQLADHIDLDPGNPKKSWLGDRVTTLKLKTDPAAPHADTEQAACYPTRSESLKLLKGNFYFARLNPGFCFFGLGVIYWLAGLTYLHLWPDSLVLTPIIFALGFWAYTKRQEGDSRITKFLSIANAIIHSTAVCVLSMSLYHANNALLPSWLLSDAYWSIPPVALFAAEMMLIGGAVGGYLFGVYLYLSSSRFNMNHNDAFSSMRLDSYRNFLRIKIKDDELTVYPIGLTDIPKRSDWRENSEKKGCPPPAYIPVEPLSPHLIEEPITIVPASKVISGEARDSSVT